MGQILQQIMGGGMAPGGAPGGAAPGGGAPGGAMAPQQPQAPNGGPESLMALLSNLMMGGSQGAAMPGQQGLNPTALGHGSLSMLLPLLLQHLLPQQMPGLEQGLGARTQPVARQPEPGGGNPGGPARGLPGALNQGNDPSRMASGILGQLGLV